MPGWITFSLDGRYIYPSSDDVIDLETREIITLLKDEHHNNVASEKMIGVHVEDGKIIRA